MILNRNNDARTTDLPTTSSFSTIEVKFVLNRIEKDTGFSLVSVSRVFILTLSTPTHQEPK